MKQSIIVAQLSAVYCVYIFVTRFTECEEEWVFAVVADLVISKFFPSVMNFCYLCAILVFIVEV
jgi:hypothetical protein